MKQINSYSMKRTTVTDVLIHFGKDVSLFRNGFMKSPFRDETYPSFHISPSGRGWKDFGDGSGGGIIDLIMRLSGKDRQGAFCILAEIERRDYSQISIPAMSRYRSERKQSPIRIYSTGPMTSEDLINYTSTRGIRKSIIEKYCTEIVLRPFRAGGDFTSYIGFPNNDGGYVLRGCRSKRCTSSSPTFINAYGEFTPKQSCNCIAVFEGFFDFLSFIQLQADESLILGFDVCVLNSVVNKDKVLSHILNYDVVRLFLDNDRAGQQTVEFFVEKTSESDVIILDESVSYASYNDLNDYLLGRMQ